MASTVSGAVASECPEVRIIPEVPVVTPLSFPSPAFTCKHVSFTCPGGTPQGMPQPPSARAGGGSGPGGAVLVRALGVSSLFSAHFNSLSIKPPRPMPSLLGGRCPETLPCGPGQKGALCQALSPPTFTGRAEGAPLWPPGLQGQLTESVNMRQWCQASPSPLLSARRCLLPGVLAEPARPGGQC